MREIAGHFFAGGFGTELIYAFVVIVCSLMVYYGTKELYELSSHKGIKYFRQAFLFFAIAYFFRSFIKFIVFYFDVHEIFDFSPRALGPVIIFFFMYFSAMAVFYLLCSVMWKKWGDNSKKIYIFHFLAFIISLVGVLFRRIWLHVGINIFMFFLVVVIVCIAYKDSKKGKKGLNLYAIYLLLLLFWILNVIGVLIPNFLPTFQIMIYMASLGVFLMIVYKVLKKAGPV
ncbi:hypothetical protein HY643_03915 [Candidatus Woesearchaeota archaeon]|nr:hypothetical protein [Candidatus Woesearchaeota archaeon]